MNSSRNERLQSFIRKFESIPALLVYSICICGALFLVQLLISVQLNGYGFPLDDAWIHQTYARSLAEGRGWSFGLNPPSAGSTSVLWTLLLVPGFWFGDLGFIYWTNVLSFVIYILLTFLTLLLFRKATSFDNGTVLMFGALVASEWHILWASGSGMETLLAALGYCLAFYLLSIEKPKSLIAGLVVGVLFAVRPDGITMIGPALLIVIWNVLRHKTNWPSIVWLLLGVILAILPMSLHNWSLTGTPFPNTFNAKVTEYTETLNLPFTFRTARMLGVFITGLGALLVPGFGYRLYQSIKKFDLWSLSFFAWFFGFVLIYILRLPVNYQHGRYLIPIIPMYLLFGFWGMNDLFGRRRFWFTFNAAILIIGLGFTTLGINTYANDVATINHLMVTPARWVEGNTQADSIIAAHDIGALGFYGNRKIIDLAGLIEPEIIPIIRDEESLLEYIKESGSDYLVILSDWYNFTLNMPVKKRFQYGNGSTLKYTDVYSIK
jgi:hypothetical protein